MALGAQAIMGGIGVAAGIGQAIGGFINLRRDKRRAEEAINSISTLKADQGVLQAAESAKMRSTKGLSGSSRKLATEGIESAAMTAFKQAKDLKSGQGLVGTGEEMRQKGALQLAKMEEEAKVRNEASAMSGAKAAAAEKTKEAKSIQEKQQLKANIALQEVASKRAAISQGLAGITGSASAFASGGNPFAGLFGKRQQQEVNTGD